jgi:hypothetical protein
VPNIFDREETTLIYEQIKLVIVGRSLSSSRVGERLPRRDKREDGGHQSNTSCDQCWTDNKPDGGLGSEHRRRVRTEGRMVKYVHGDPAVLERTGAGFAAPRGLSRFTHISPRFSGPARLRPYKLTHPLSRAARERFSVSALSLGEPSTAVMLLGSGKEEAKPLPGRTSPLPIILVRCSEVEIASA